MKYFRLLFLVLIVASCQSTTQQHPSNKGDKALPPTGNFGKEVAAAQAVAAENIPAAFSAGDTLAMTINGKISSSCKHSGCWMDLDMKNGQTVHVTFKDESFTIPLDAAGKNAIAEGLALRELISVEQLQIQARDDGKSEEEIAAIKEPKYEYEFVADGVLIEE
jgi:hypothetical protein